jgi:hypothetical protein
LTRRRDRRIQWNAPEMVSGHQQKEIPVKKQIKSKKLTLQRETVADLQRATAGVDNTLYNDTVYRPQPSDYCTRGCPQIS